VVLGGQGHLAGAEPSESRDTGLVTSMSRHFISSPLPPPGSSPKSGGHQGLIESEGPGRTDSRPHTDPEAEIPTWPTPSAMSTWQPRLGVTVTATQPP
jgi:hypothetical protein